MVHLEVDSFNDIAYHQGHEIVCVVTNGTAEIVCVDCNFVLVSADEPEEPYWDGGVENGSRYGRQDYSNV